MTRKNISLKDAHGHVKKLRPIIGPHNGLQVSQNYIYIYFLMVVETNVIF